MWMTLWLCSLSLVDFTEKYLIMSPLLQEYMDPMNEHNALNEAKQMIAVADENQNHSLELDEILKYSEYFTGSKLMDYARNVHEEFWRLVSLVAPKDGLICSACVRDQPRNGPNRWWGVIACNCVCVFCLCVCCACVCVCVLKPLLPLLLLQQCTICKHLSSVLSASDVEAQQQR